MDSSPCRNTVRSLSLSLSSWSISTMALFDSLIPLPLPRSRFPHFPFHRFSLKTSLVLIPSAASSEILFLFTGAKFPEMDSFVTTWQISHHERQGKRHEGWKTLFKRPWRIISHGFFGMDKRTEGSIESRHVSCSLTRVRDRSTCKHAPKVFRHHPYIHSPPLLWLFTPDVSSCWISHAWKQSRLISGWKETRNKILLWLHLPPW